MHRWVVWTRLVWREVRQGWPVILAGLLLPPAVFPAVGEHPQREWLVVFGIVGLFGVPLLVAVWAARKANPKRRGSEFAPVHLPTSPISEWSASYLLPLVVCALIGMWYGYWAAVSQHWHNRGAVEATSAMYMSAVFAVSYLLSSATSLWAAVLASVIMTPMAGYIEPGGPNLLIHAAFRACLGATVGTVFLALRSRKHSLRASRTISILIALGIPLVFYSGDIVRHAQVAQLGHTDNISYVWREDGSFFVFCGRPADSPRKGWEGASVRDMRRGTVRRRLFQSRTAILDAPDPSRVYLAQQRPGRDELDVLVWNATEDTVARVARIKTRADALSRPQTPWWWTMASIMSAILPPLGGHVSPDGHYLAMPVRSPAGSGLDLWIIDLLTGRGNLVLINQPFGSQEAGWNSSKLYLSGSAVLAEVDLRTMKARLLAPEDIGGGKM